MNPFNQEGQKVGVQVNVGLPKRISRNEMYDIIHSHVFATDEWGGTKLANWQWGNNVCVDGIDDAVDALMKELFG